jgi:hypothetical protein
MDYTLLVAAHRNVNNSGNHGRAANEAKFYSEVTLPAWTITIALHARTLISAIRSIAKKSSTLAPPTLYRSADQTGV